MLFALIRTDWTEAATDLGAMRLRFIWDVDKAIANARNHGISFDEATTAFDDPLSLTIPDPDRSHSEERFVLIGQSKQQHLVVVAHVERGDVIRIISARPATRRERKTYEEG
jgi:uncharacterized DUF497 family protein